MSNSLGQFVVGFVLAFSPAPFVGMGTYALVQAEDAPAVRETERVKPAKYGAPLDREYGGESGVYFTEDGYPAAVPASTEPQQGEMEVETDCKRRKKAKKAEPKPQPKQPEVPPL